MTFTFSTVHGGWNAFSHFHTHKLCDIFIFNDLRSYDYTCTVHKRIKVYFLNVLIIAFY